VKIIQLMVDTSDGESVLLAACDDGTLHQGVWANMDLVWLPVSTPTKSAEIAPSASANNDYAAAQRVFNEWFFNYRGASHDTGDYCEWMEKRLHSGEPNVA
jgi:hypothetical protein